MLLVFSFVVVVFSRSEKYVIIQSLMDFFNCAHECLANNQCDVSTTVWTTNCSADFEEVKEVGVFCLSL